MTNIIQKPHLPIFLMFCIVVFLFITLIFRVVMADRDLALQRISDLEAMLAAESGINLGINLIRGVFQKPNPTHDSPALLVRKSFERNPFRMWKKIGVLTGAQARITGLRVLAGIDNNQTPFLDESTLVRIESEGKRRGKAYHSAAIVAVTNLVSHYAVVNSLNEFYYGLPIQHWVSEAGNLEAFMKANHKLFYEDGFLAPRGLCYDANLLCQMFKSQGPDPFLPPKGKQKQPGNYGTLFYSREGSSPCQGPLYCKTSIVVDSHQFLGPIQTSGYFFRRGNSQPSVQDGQSSLRLTSSRRVQKVMDHLEGEVPERLFVDQDSTSSPDNLSSWNPDFNSLYRFAAKEGIIVNSGGKGSNRGEKTSVDYHLGKHHLYSDTYFTPVSTKLEQDEANENFIELASEMKYNGKNNLDAASLNQAKILYSENSIFIRGEIGGDLVIATPKHIYLTGSLNPQISHNLLLIAGEGVAISTTDLEKFISTQNPSPEEVGSVRQWKIGAVLYKPGSGWYGSWGKPSPGGLPVIPDSNLTGGFLSITINGACLEGNLNRWLQYSVPGCVKVVWNPHGVDRLPIVPQSINLLRMHTVAE